jgi:YD repeat-containing protein
VYTQDANGRIIKKTTTPGVNSNYTDNRSYSYDASGRLIADSQYNGNTIARYVTYKYDTDGDITEVEQFIRNTTSFVTYGASTFNYDNKRNPYHQTGKLLYYISSLSSYISKSNVLIISAGSNPVSSLKYANKYYSNGLLKTSYSKDPFWSTFERAEYIYKQP